MQNSTRIFKLLLIALLFFTGPLVFGQSILNPADTLVNYDTAHKPTIPNNGIIAKWVRTPRLSWSTTGYKAYIYNSNPFRLYFPKSYNPTANDGKKYPMLIFQHGVGEGGTVYDNEYQLFHGGDVFKAGVDNGTFDGYILCMQTAGAWGPNQFSALKDIIDYMIANNKLDPFHVTGNGLSGGGAGTWSMFLTYPTYESGIIPMSAVDISYTSSTIVNEVKYTPIWNIHGGQDGSPAPYTAAQVLAAMTAGGANYTDLNMTTQGHDTWDSTWSMPAFWPFLNNAYSANPWTLFGRTQFCPGDPINVTIGLCAGYQAYQWRKDGVVINGATSNTITATVTGTYDARLERGGIWSDWSHVPVVISIKTPTITPPISVSGAMSDVLPGADGKTTVNLQVPDSGYTSYTWKKIGSDSVIGTQRILTVSQPGQYILSVTQQFGCSSVYSAPFRVVNAAGPNPPSAATNLVSNALSFTQVELDWARNPNPVNPETGFEIYRSLSTGGPYTFVGLVPADTVRFVDQGLKPNVKYYYVVRAVDSTGAAALSNETNVVTQSDKTPPVAPTNLKVVSTNQSSISLIWNTATDNVSVSKYFVYVNGAKSYVVTAPDTSFVVGGLDSSKQYSFAVTAADGSGNVSVQSNQVSAATVINGLTYSYYTTTSAWSVLPNFSTLTPVLTGNMPNVSIANATQASNYGYVWKGYIRIPVAGTYTFATSSDDGSAMWFNTQTPGTISTATVNNDGAHATQQATSTARTLQPGVYPVCYEFFQAGGGAAMTVSWACTALFGDNAQHTIADTYFASPFVPAGTAPKMPVQIHATATAYNKVNISWVDSSNNESGFEIYRSTSSSGTYSIVTTTAANVVAFTDSTVQPSTTYYYKVQAINQYGASGFDPASLGGIQYSFYTNFTASNLLTLKTLTPTATGTLTNISLSPATTTTNYAFKFQGTINIPTTGSYTFYTASDDGSDLYIGGFDSAHLVVKNDFLQGTTERSGVLTLTKGAYPIFVTYFQQGGGFALTASYQGPGITKKNIPDSAFVNTNSMTTTPSLPAIPSAPYQLVAGALSSSRTGLSWQDSSATVTGYQVYRSVADTTHFVLLATVAANSYTDTALFANSTYYYKVNATGVGGNSATTATVSVKTLDNLPVITKLSAQQVRYGTTVSLPFSATHAGGGALVYTGINLPSFSTLTDNHDGTAALALSPAVTDQNTYPNLGVVVTDAFGGADTTIFSLVVNNSYAPVIDTIASYSMNEGDSLSITLNSHEQNASDTLTVGVSGAPVGYVLTPVSNGVATLVLHPGYSASGVYTVQVKVLDNNGLSTVRTFGVTVKDKSPNTSIYTHVAYQDAVPLPWNSLLGTSTSNLLDSAGNTTTVGLNFSPASWWTPFNGGATTGNNSGVYPDHVLQDYMWFGSAYGGPDVFNGQVTGLDTAQQYSLTFFASSNYNGFADNGTTTYTVGSQTVSLAVQNNTKNTAVISNIKPAADGTVSFAMGKTATTTLGYFNALVITKQFDDGTAPAGASLLTGQVSTGKVQLNWTDSAYNATGYQVWRAPASSGVFALLGTVMGNTANSFVDSNIVGNTKYLYTVRAYNGHGNSGYSDTVTLTTLNRLPKVNALADVTLKNNQQTTINVTTVDDPSAQLTLSVTGLPPFATFTDNGNGTGTINVVPSAGTVGVYPNITVTATDVVDSTATASFTLAVTEPNVSSVYVNFTGGPTCPKPWNTLLTPPFAGTVMSNLLDDGNNATGISLTMPDGFYWFSASGMQPNNGTTVYPASVVRSGVYEPTTATRRLQVSGLDVSKTYNFVFFNSQEDGTNGLTNFTINGQTVTLQASFNSNKTVQINGIVPDASGGVTISVAKASGASNAYLSSLVIQGYATNTAAVLNPTDLRVLSNTQGTVSLQWQDRAANEAGFEVWRADNSGVYAPVATLPAGTVTYTDTHLSRNGNYYYIVRAVMGSTASDYSNVVAVTTYSDVVYINVNSASAGPKPWNNLNTVPQSGFTWSNFLDSTGNTTSIGMVCTGLWAGLNSLGQVTGNNSGVYPDAVILEDYVAFQGQVGGLLLTGLNLSKKYDLTFLASCNQFGDNTTAFVVNGDTVLSDAMYNSGSTVTMYGVTPDANGQISLSVLPYKLTSAGGWINAMVVQGYTQSSSNAPAPPQTTGGANRLAAAATGASFNMAGQALAMDTVLSVYPNPFQQFFTLQVPGFVNNDKVNVTVYNLSGQQVYAKEFDGLAQGQNFLRVDANQSFAKSGIYIVRVIYGNARYSKTFKLLKN